MCCLFSCRFSFFSLVTQVKEEKKNLINEYSLFSFPLFILFYCTLWRFFLSQRRPISLHCVVSDYMFACIHTIRCLCVHVFRLSSNKMMRKWDIFLCICVRLIERNEFCQTKKMNNGNWIGKKIIFDIFSHIKPIDDMLWVKKLQRNKWIHSCLIRLSDSKLSAISSYVKNGTVKPLISSITFQSFFIFRFFRTLDGQLQTDIFNNWHYPHRNKNDWKVLISNHNTWKN